MLLSNAAILVTAFRQVEHQFHEPLPQPFQIIEDQVETELELVGVVVARVHDVFDGQLSKVGRPVGSNGASRAVRDALRTRFAENW